MLQIRNDLEIIELLRKGPRHIRRLGEEIGLIPSTVMRTIRKLEEENTLDFRQEGKNKVYFLKNTPEAKAYIFLTENYKLLKALNNAKVRRIVKELQEKTKGELIVLFGSYAKNNYKKGSDIDIYLETQNKQLKKELEKISEKLSIKIGKLNKDNLLTKEIIKDHIIIQNIDRFYQITR